MTDEGRAHPHPPTPPIAHVALEVAVLVDRTPVTFTQAGPNGCLFWTVVELDGTSVPGSRGPRCLVFTRPDFMRRVWDYPPDWRTLGAAELAAVSWRH
jgi:hypothetical protein